MAEEVSFTSLIISLNLWLQSALPNSSGLICGGNLVLRQPCISNSLIQPAFTGRHNGALLSQPSERNGNFFLIAARHPIC